MKIIIAIASIIFAMTTVAEAQKVEGLGIFKIGGTVTQDLKAFAEGQDEDMVTFNSLTEFAPLWLQKGQRFYKLVRNEDQPENSPMNTFDCLGVETYFLGVYEVAGIKVEQLFFIFFNDTLAAIRSTNCTDEIKNALNTKYGKPTLRSEEKEFSCYLSHIEELLNKKTTWFYSQYGTGRVIAEHFLGTIFTDGCDENILSWLTIKNVALAEKILACDATTKAERAQQKEREARKNLKDF